jgi:hypothetical protein
MGCDGSMRRNCGISDPVAWRDNHVNFYNKYLFLTDYTDEQAGR